MKRLRLLIIGFCMGFMEVIPAVSGGNIAVVTGVFDDIIHCLKEFFRLQTAKQVVRFQWHALYERLRLSIILPIGIGAVISMISMAHALSYAFDVIPWYLWAFFTGVVLFTGVRIATMVKQWTMSTILIFIGSCILSFSIIIASQIQLPATMLWYGITGLIVSIAVILPGISTSFVLLILGQYERILAAVKTMDLVVLLSVGIGAVIGFIAFVSVLEHCLVRYHNYTYAALAGLVLGSLPELWPWTVDTKAPMLLAPLFHNSLISIALLLGIVFMYLLTRFTKS